MSDEAVWTDEDEIAQQESADYEAHVERQMQDHYRQLEGEEREREERYAESF